MITHQPVEHTARLLRVHQVLVDVARVLERFLHSALGDLVKCHPANALGFVAIFLLLFLLLGSVAEFLGQVPRDGFAFTVGVRRQIDAVR